MNNSPTLPVSVAILSGINKMSHKKSEYKDCTTTNITSYTFYYVFHFLFNKLMMENIDLILSTKSTWKKKSKTPHWKTEMENFQFQKPNSFPLLSLVQSLYILLNLKIQPKAQILGFLNSVWKLILTNICCFRFTNIHTISKLHSVNITDERQKRKFVFIE